MICTTCGGSGELVVIKGHGTKSFNWARINGLVDDIERFKICPICNGYGSEESD